jgi:Ca-activated chloride channel family protein
VVGGAQGPPPARIVLLPDGKQTIPNEDLSGPRGAFTAARDAADSGVPISAISFGTSYGVVDINGTPVRVPAADDAMRQIAQLSNGEFYDAESLDDLSKVYVDLAEQIGYETEHKVARMPWLVAGTVTALIASGGALVIGQRLP